MGSSIKGIQDSTADNVERVSEAARGVPEATELAGVSGGALAEILNLSAENAALIAGIATAAGAFPWRMLRLILRPPSAKMALVPKADYMPFETGDILFQ